MFGNQTNTTIDPASILTSTNCLQDILNARKLLERLLRKPDKKTGLQLCLGGNVGYAFSLFSSLEVLPYLWLCIWQLTSFKLFLYPTILPINFLMSG